MARWQKSRWQYQPADVLPLPMGNLSWNIANIDKRVAPLETAGCGNRKDRRERTGKSSNVKGSDSRRDVTLPLARKKPPQDRWSQEAAVTVLRPGGRA